MMHNASALPTCPQQQTQPQTVDRNGPKITHTTSRRASASAGDLGRYEDLQASGQLERLLRSGARFAAKAMVLSAAADDAAIKIAVRRIGPALVFERLREETGCRAVIAEMAGKSKHGSALERAAFLTVLHRLFVSGSDRAADRWREGLHDRRCRRGDGLAG
jgi:hypothetical protein